MRETVALEATGKRLWIRAMIVACYCQLSQRVAIAKQAIVVHTQLSGQYTFDQCSLPTPAQQALFNIASKWR